MPSFLETHRREISAYSLLLVGTTAAITVVLVAAYRYEVLSPSSNFEIALNFSLLALGVIGSFIAVGGKTYVERPGVAWYKNITPQGRTAVCILFLTLVVGTVKELHGAEKQRRISEEAKENLRIALESEREKLETRLAAEQAASALLNEELNTRLVLARKQSDHMLATALEDASEEQKRAINSAASALRTNLDSANTALSEGMVSQQSQLRTILTSAVSTLGSLAHPDSGVQAHVARSEESVRRHVSVQTAAQRDSLTTRLSSLQTDLLHQLAASTELVEAISAWTVRSDSQFTRLESTLARVVTEQERLTSLLDSPSEPGTAATAPGSRMGTPSSESSTLSQQGAAP